MRLKTTLKTAEPLLLFAVLFLPALLQQENASVSVFFSSLTSMLIYLLIIIPQILFILYFFKLKKEDTANTGLVKIRLSILPSSIFYTMLLLVTSNLIVLLFNKAGIVPSSESFSAVKTMLPLYLAVSLATGYREELFFRSCLLPAIMTDTISPVFSVAGVSLLFSLCHISQGYPGVAVSFAGSIILSVIFLKHRNIHINALTHALFNFLILAATVFSV